MDRAVALILVAGCGSAEMISSPPPFAREVVRFEPGEGAGFGQDRYPDVVLGPPLGESTSAASLDVLSLGAFGEIVIGFGEQSITDGAGPDFVVFENPFYVRGDPNDPYAELGEVSVSTDAVSWRKFACNTEGQARWPGCAGWTPTFPFDPTAPIDPESCGGDAFDLAEVGMSEARYVRIVDLDAGGEMPSVGFDLDAVGLVHHRSTE
jgi:hypothetical protein